jgi:hypothetical protein
MISYSPQHSAQGREALPFLLADLDGDGQEIAIGEPEADERMRRAGAAERLDEEPDRVELPQIEGLVVVRLRVLRGSDAY